jgi:hypothetical protein
MKYVYITESDTMHWWDRRIEIITIEPGVKVERCFR